jgi:hypothetical protein
MKNFESEAIQEIPEKNSETENPTKKEARVGNVWEKKFPWWI